MIQRSGLLFYLPCFAGTAVLRRSFQSKHNNRSTRHLKNLIPISGLILFALAALPINAGTEKPALIRLETKDQGYPDLDMRFEEITRNPKTSKIKITGGKSGDSVRSNMFVLHGCYEIAKARGAEYFVTLQEWTENTGAQIYVVGFSLIQNPNLKKEFGEEVAEAEIEENGYVLNISDMKRTYEPETNGGLGVAGRTTLLRSRSGDMDRKNAAEAAVLNLSDRDPEVQRKAVISLADKDQIGNVPVSALEPLLLMVKNKDVWIRVWTIEALARLGPKHLDRTGPVFLAALEDEHDVSVAAARIVGWQKLEKGIPQLLRMTKRENSLECHVAAEALSRIGTDEANAAYRTYVKTKLPELLDDLSSSDEDLALDADTNISLMGAAMVRLDMTSTPEGKMVLAAKEQARQEKEARKAKESKEPELQKVTP